VLQGHRVGLTHTPIDCQTCLPMYPSTARGLLRQGLASSMPVTREGPDALSRYCPVRAFDLGKAASLLAYLGERAWMISTK